jgi:hypothetical protein
MKKNYFKKSYAENEVFALRCDLFGRKFVNEEFKKLNMGKDTTFKQFAKVSGKKCFNKHKSRKEGKK